MFFSRLTDEIKRRFAYRAILAELFQRFLKQLQDRRKQNFITYIYLAILGIENVQNNITFTE